MIDIFQIPIELAELHDALLKAPSLQHTLLIIREFRENVRVGSDGRYLTLVNKNNKNFI